MDDQRGRGPKYIIIINFKVFVGLPVISKKTMTKNKTDDLKINEEFEVIYVDNKTAPKQASCFIDDFNKLA